MAMTLALGACAGPSAVTPVTSAPPAAAARGVELVWLGQAAFKITAPGGQVIVTDPWLRTNPLTPPEYKRLSTSAASMRCWSATATSTTWPTRPCWPRCTRCRCAPQAT
jgi:hypothetical protein